MSWNQAWWTKSAAQLMEIMRWAMKTSQRKSRQHWGDALRLENRGDHDRCRHPNRRNCLVGRENCGLSPVVYPGAGPSRF